MRTINELLSLVALSAQALEELPGQWQRFGGVSFGCNLSTAGQVATENPVLWDGDEWLRR